MMKRMQRVLLAALVLPGVAAVSSVKAEEAAVKAEAAVAEAAPAEKNPVARLRGRLLYKKGQIRKLEKAAAEVNEALKNKVDDLEQERRAQYVAAEPKLVELYAEQDALEVMEAMDEAFDEDFGDEDDAPELEIEVIEYTEAGEGEPSSAAVDTVQVNEEGVEVVVICGGDEAQ